MYVSKGESGGLISLVFFIAIIARSFGRIGKARKSVQGRKREWFMWLLGAALYANVMAFFGVSYWDQTVAAWFVLLAMISTATIAVNPKRVQHEVSAITEHQMVPVQTLDLDRSKFPPVSDLRRTEIECLVRALEDWGGA